MMRGECEHSRWRALRSARGAAPVMKPACMARIVGLTVDRFCDAVKVQVACMRDPFAVLSELRLALPGAHKCITLEFGAKSMMLWCILNDAWIWDYCVITELIYAV